MDEIALLQAQLAAVQQQESALKLSDHNVIDLLTKLQQLGKIQFVNTLTGKQILTPRQIEREIEDHVSLNGGRISIAELSQLIGIDRSYVERHVAQVARANRHASGPNASQFFVVNNGEEVITNWYLDAIMEDANTLLQESGTTSIGELAQQFGFAVEYMKEVVVARLGSILKAQERSNVLYTHSFVASQKAQIRGVFSAITRPTFVPDLVRSYKFDEKVVEEHVPELIAKRVLMGTLRGREYVPYVFMEAQRESMYSFFQQNGYLDHARAQQLQVARPYDFLKKRFPDAIPLKDYVVSHALLLQLEGSIEVAVNDASYVDVRSIVPSAIHTVDASTLLSKSELVRNSSDVVQIADVYAVSKAFLTACLDVFQKDATTKAQRASITAQSQRTSPETGKDSTSHDDGDNEDDDDDDGGKRGRKGKKAAKSAATEEEKPSKRGKGSKAAAQEERGGKKNAKSGKRGKKGGDVDSDDADEPSASGKRSRGHNAAITITPSVEEMQELLVKAFPHTEDDEEFVACVTEHLQTEVSKVYSSALALALSSVHRGDAVSLRDLRKKFEDQLDELTTLLSIYEKGFNKLELHVDGKNAADMEQLKNVEIHLIESIGAEIATLVTSFVMASQSIDMDDVPAFDTLVRAPASDATSETPVPPSQSMTALSDDNKKVLEKHLAPATATALVRLWTFTTAGRRSLGDFTSHLPVVATALGVPPRKSDRKKERQIIFAYRHSVIGALESVGDEEYAAVAALLTQLLFQQTTGLPASLPRANVAVCDTVVRAFAASLPATAVERLSEFVATAARLSEGAGTAEDVSRWASLVEEVRTLVLAKDINAAITSQE